MAPHVEGERSDFRDWGASAPFSLQSRISAEAWPGMLAFIDTGFVYRFANQAFADSLGRRVEDVVGRTVREVDGAERFGLLRSPMAEAIAGRGGRLQTDWNGPGGLRSVLEVHYIPTSAPCGRPMGFHLVAFDVTGTRLVLEDRERQAAAVVRETEARLAAETALHRLEPLAAVGQLTAGLVHDLNNILMLSQGAVARLRRPEVSAADGGSLDMAIASLGRASEMARGLLAFARARGGSAVPTDCSQFVMAIADLLRMSLPPGLRLKMDLANDLPLVAIDPQRFISALLNLVLNARDAMPAGGDIVLRTAHAGPVRGAGLGDVWVSVTDAGSGIDPITLARLPEAFFTTKPAGVGTGLGLTMVAAFAADHSGRLHLESQMGRGTTVRIELPGLG